MRRLVLGCPYCTCKVVLPKDAEFDCLTCPNFFRHGYSIFDKSDTVCEKDYALEDLECPSCHAYVDKYCDFSPGIGAEADDDDDITEGEEPVV